MAHKFSCRGGLTPKLGHKGWDSTGKKAGAHLTHWLPKLCTNGTQIFL
ncbi:hypothetical protein [Kamptonema formosum]|nr:hypothetical protein [Oscillatoria sp. PCC 10802]